MKKYLLIAAAGLILPFAGQAQTGLSIGVYGGPVLSNVIATTTNNFGDNTAYNSKIGGTGGVQVIYGFGESGKASAVVGAGFASKGWKSDVVNDNNVLETKNSGIHYVDIPIQFRYLFDFGLFVETGPYVGMLVGANWAGETEFETVEDGSVVKKPVKDAYQSTDFGWVGGVGYMHSKGFGAQIRHNTGLANIANEDIWGSGSKVINTATSLTFFYMLGWED